MRQQPSPVIKRHTIEHDSSQNGYFRELGYLASSYPLMQQQFESLPKVGQDGDTFVMLGERANKYLRPPQQYFPPHLHNQVMSKVESFATFGQQPSLKSLQRQNDYQNSDESERSQPGIRHFQQRDLTQSNTDSSLMSNSVGGSPVPSKLNKATNIQYYKTPRLQPSQLESIDEENRSNSQILLIAED